jgi:tetratricopeptide (TPR) repeat protein
MLVTESGGADKPVTVSDMLARSESLVAAEYAQNPDYRAAILGVLGNYYHTIGQDERSESLLRDALAAVRTSADPDLRRELTCLHAMSLSALGRVNEAVDALNTAIRDPGIDARIAANCLQYLSYINQDGGDARNALRYANMALAKLHEVKHPSPSQQGLFLGSIGFAHQLNGENDAAEKYFNESITQYARAGRDRSPDAISVRNNWAIVSLGAGEPRRALELFDETLRIVAQKDPGAQPPQYLVANRARALEALGRYEDARDAYSLCEPKVPGNASAAMDQFCLLGIASVERELGNLATADEYIAKTAASISPTVPQGFPARVTLRMMRAKVAISKGQFAAARTQLDSVLADARMDTLVLSALLIRGELNLGESKLPAALNDARRALTLAQQARGGVPYSSRVGQASLLIARIFARQGDATQARRAAQTAVDNLSQTVDGGHPWLKEARQLAS